MKLEYIPDGSIDAPLIQLYGFSAEQAGRLQAIFASLAGKRQTSVDLHAQNFIYSVRGCQLTLISGRWDQGIMQVGPPATFQCQLTPGTWMDVEGLSEPFADAPCGGFQWLNETAIPLLLSHHGQW